MSEMWMRLCCKRLAFHHRIIVENLFMCRLSYILRRIINILLLLLIFDIAFCWVIIYKSCRVSSFYFFKNLLDWFGRNRRQFLLHLVLFVLFDFHQFCSTLLTFFSLHVVGFMMRSLFVRLRSVLSWVKLSRI